MKKVQSYEKSHNKAFKSDSQRLAFSLRSSIAKRCSHLNAALYLKLHTYNYMIKLIFFDDRCLN
ncbi:hypothetical protein CSB62_25840 [Vibrio splendidus]|nr:hypothetical protein CSB62_25840 [Vibrio splendidus]